MSLFSRKRMMTLLVVLLAFSCFGFSYKFMITVKQSTGPAVFSFMRRSIWVFDQPVRVNSFDISVYQDRGDLSEPKVAWSISADTGREHLLKGITYGVLPPEFSEAGRPATLVPGTRYHVSAHGGGSFGSTDFVAR